LDVSTLPESAAAGDQPVSLRARWVFPVWGAPLENGVVEITAGRISAVHDRSDPATVDLGNAAIVPGLVNAHTHLELSDVDAPLQPAAPFTAWLKTVIAHRRARASRAPAVAANVAADLAAPVRGRDESGRRGTTTIGDIAGPNWNTTFAPGTGPRIVPFLEVLGLVPERAADQLKKAQAHLAVGDGILRGLSPHAPYSVHPDLFRAVIDLAVKHRAPLAMHLAESRAELELLANGAGEFLPFLEELGVWNADAFRHGSRPLDYLREMARAECALAIHGNYFSKAEIDFLCEHPNISVVYCPRTHAFFRHGVHPWRELLGGGVNVALGTDSRASNPDLGLWNELLFLRKLAPDFDPAALLKLGTWNGAFAMGLEAEAGSLVVGKCADLAVVEVAEGDGSEWAGSDAYSLLFRPANRIAATLCAGRWLLD
jgi:cytosine/adenosine deaminase-related metal-dependent hydrolase